MGGLRFLISPEPGLRPELEQVRLRLWPSPLCVQCMLGASCPQMAGGAGVLPSTGPAGCLSLCMELCIDARPIPWAISDLKKGVL